MASSGLERGARFGAAVLILIAVAARADETKPVEPPSGPVEVGVPVVPTITPAARDLPDAIPDPSLFRLEMLPVDDDGAISTRNELKRRVDPLLHLQGLGEPRLPDGFGVPVHNYEGYRGASPPDANVDVGPQHVVQVANGSTSTATILDKATGAVLKTFYMASLTTAMPCRWGFCDPVVLYDRAADRWLIAEISGEGNSLCVYVSTGSDPTGSWYAYAFAVEGAGMIADYPKFGVWPQTGGGSYLVGINAGLPGYRDIAAFDRAKMLAGQPSPFQKFTFPRTPAGPQVTLPTTMQGPTPPPDGEPAIFMRHIDDEWHYAADTPATDWLELRALQIDWQTPANSTLTLLSPVTISEFRSPCIGNLNCMPQPGTFQKLIALVPLLHPLQYRNFGDHETIVGTFDVDTDGTDHIGLRWFELRKTGASPWSLFQEGTFGGEVNVHRSIGSIALDGSGNIAIGYSRTGRLAPYYPSVYYRGRLATDPLGTMPQGEFSIWDGTTSKTNDNRWGDYSGIGIDPSDDCTFWYTNQFGGYGETRVAAFKFDACGCLAIPPSPSITAAAPVDNRIDVTWDDSPTASIVSYRVYRATSAGGPYEQIAEVADSSLGVPDGPSYAYFDDSVSGGTRYYYVVKSSDGDKCISGSSNEANALATGACTLAPIFAGLGDVTNPGASTCTLNLAWAAATAACSGSVTYNVYRSTSGDFIPGPENLVATGLSALNFTDAVGIAGGTTYFYVVRAVGGNGAEDVNLARRSATPAGPLVPLDWTETFEGSQSGGGFDQAGWTKSVLSGTTDWVWSSDRSYDGTHSWHAPGDIFNDKVLVSPPFVVVAGTFLTFRHTFQFEGTTTYCVDGGTLEYTIDGGTTWTVVPAADFAQGAYNGTVSLITGNPIAGKRAWCADNGGVWSQPTIVLGNDLVLRNQTVRLRWHEGDDIQNAAPALGWYVDTVNLSNARIGSACSVGAGALTVSNNGPICEGASLNLSAGYSQAGVTYAWAGPNGFTSSFQNPSIPSATSAAGGTYFVIVNAGPTPIASSSTVVSVVADGGACSDGDACTVGDACGGGVCVPGAPGPVPGVAAGLGFGTVSDLSWDPVAEATGYDVVRGTLSTLKVAGDFTTATDACSANDLAATSLTDAHVPAQDDGDWFLVRGRSACGNGTYDDGSASEVGSRDASIAASANTCP